MLTARTAGTTCNAPHRHLAQLALMATRQVVADNPWPRSGISAGWIVLFALLTWRVYHKAPRRTRRTRAKLRSFRTRRTREKSR